MEHVVTPSTVNRRDILKLGATAVTASAVDRWVPRQAEAQTPKRGGVFRLAGFEPPHFDPHQTPHWWTFINLSFTHSRLVKVKAGPAVAPGTLPLEGDLAESWSQPTNTTWVFKLRKGVRWHPKPPVNGREVTAEDVKFTYERAMTLKGNPNRSVVDEIERVGAVDPYTVKFTTKKPFAWFLDGTAQLTIHPKEVVEKFGDLKKPESPSAASARGSRSRGDVRNGRSSSGQRRVLHASSPERAGATKRGGSSAISTRGSRKASVLRTCARRRCCSTSCPNRRDEIGMRLLVAHCHAGLAKLYRHTGKQIESDAHFAAATSMYRGMGWRTGWRRQNGR